MRTNQTAEIVAFPEHEVSLEDAFLRGLNSRATRKVYEHALRVFDGFLGERGLLGAGRRDVEALRATLAEQGRSPATICKLLSGLSSFYRFAVQEGVIDRNPATTARRPKVSDVSPRQALSAAEVKAIFSIGDTSTVVGLRDVAMLLLLGVQGWRIAEVLALHVEDLREEEGHKVATVHGKGSKVQRVTLAAATWQVVQVWITEAAITDGPVFVNVGRDKIPKLGKAIGQQAAWKRLQLLARRAGVLRHVHAHLFRHSAVTEALAAGVALHLVSDFARHSDPATTRRYDSHRQALSNPAPHVLAAKFGV
jgi:integrase/recombinase XerD